MPPVCMKRRIVSPAYSIVHTKHRKISAGLRAQDRVSLGHRQKLMRLSCISVLCVAMRVSAAMVTYLTRHGRNWADPT